MLSLEGMGAPPPTRKNPGGVRGFFEGIYYDPFKWSLVKSWGFFATGVYLCGEIAQIDLSVAAPPM